MSKREIYAMATTNNDPPSEEMVNGAKEDMSEGLKELDRVQSELRKLREQMARLEEDEKAIQQGLDVCSCILSPIRHLPFDVLEEIFLHCLSEDDNQPPTIRDIAQAPLLLMRVCRTWRQICLACPQLWTSLRLENLDFRAPSANWEGIFRRIQGWLSRSGQCPIHIVMSSTRRYMRKGDNDNAVVDALLPFMHRCNSLYLSGEHQPFIDLLSPAVLVALRSVKIEPIAGAGSYLSTWLPLRKLMAAPNLQSFSCISATPSNISITEIPLHLSPHLTHLVLQGAETPYQDVLAALQRLPELRHLGISFRHQSLTDAIVPVKVSLPVLERLIVFDYANPSRTATFLDCLTDLSSLCSLDCQTSSRPVAYIVDHSLCQDAIKKGFSFAAYSLLAKKIETKNLRHLGISLNLNNDQVVDCFRMLPYIAKLDLTNCYKSTRKKKLLPEHFNVEPLIVQPNTPVLLPRLRFISIKNSRHITDEVVFQFIISRIQALPCSDTSDGKVAVLESIEGVFLRKEQKDIVSAVRQYAIDAGIEKVPHAKFTYEPYSY